MRAKNPTRLIKASLLLFMLSGCVSTPSVNLDHLLFLEKTRPNTPSAKVVHSFSKQPLNTYWSTSNPMTFSYASDQTELGQESLEKITTIVRDWQKNGGKMVRVKVGKSSAKSAIQALMIANRRSLYLETQLQGTFVDIERRFDPELPVDSLQIELG
jgi:hypothetical protein